MRKQKWWPRKYLRRVRGGVCLFRGRGLLVQRGGPARHQAGARAHRPRAVAWVELAAGRTGGTGLRRAGDRCWGWGGRNVRIVTRLSGKKTPVQLLCNDCETKPTFFKLRLQHLCNLYKTTKSNLFCFRKVAQLFHKSMQPL